MQFSSVPCGTCRVTGDRTHIKAVYPPRGMYTRDFEVSWDQWDNPHLRSLQWRAHSTPSGHRVTYDRGLHEHLYQEALYYARNLWRGSSG